MRGWTFVFAALTAVVSVALALQVREIRRLREELVAVTAAKGRAAGIEPGQSLPAFTLHDAARRDVRVDFGGASAGSVLLFHASGCDACASSVASWRGAVQP